MFKTAYISVKQALGFAPVFDSIEMADFVENHLSVLEQDVACYLIRMIGGWESLTKAAASKEVVDLYLGLPVHMHFDFFNDHRRLIQRMMARRIGDAAHKRSDNVAIVAELQGSVVEVRERDIWKAFEYGMNDANYNEREVVLVRWVLGHASRSLTHDYDVYRSKNL